jgi:hypothetical protein
VNERQSNDETPVADAAAPPPDTSQKTAAVRAAKLALWSPFAGLFFLCFALAVIGTVESKGDPLRFAPTFLFAMILSWSIWLGGVIFGIISFRRTKTGGRKGIIGRVLIGLSLNSLLLAATICGVLIMVVLQARLREVREKEAQADAKEIRAKVGNGQALQNQLAAAAMGSFLKKASEFQKEYEACGRALINPPVLSMASRGIFIEGKIGLYRGPNCFPAKNSVASPGF